jgi:hypothetical protein
LNFGFRCRRGCVYATAVNFARKLLRTVSETVPVRSGHLQFLKRRRFSCATISMIDTIDMIDMHRSAVRLCGQSPRFTTE